MPSVMRHYMTLTLVVWEVHPNVWAMHKNMGCFEPCIGHHRDHEPNDKFCIAFHNLSQ